MKIFDAFLNASFLFLCLLFVTGGFVPPGDAPHARLGEINQLGPWTVGFLLLVAVRRLVDRRGTFGEIWFVRVLRALANRIAAMPGLVYLLTAVWALMLIAVAIQRHLAFDDNGDLAIFDQAFWNTTHGVFLRSSLIPERSGEIILFADHFDPLQLALIPLYAIFPSPMLFLVVQSLALALGAIPLYWLARDRFPESPVLAAIFPVVYLLYLPLRGANRYDYHPSALVPPLLFLALYFMEKARWPSMIVCLVLVGLLKENLPIAGVIIGLYLAFARGWRRLGLVVAIVFALWTYAGFAWIVPAFSPDGRYPHFLRYAALGEAPSHLLLAPLEHPMVLLSTLLTPARQKLGYLLWVFGPVVFLPLLSPFRLSLTLPFLAQNLLSTAPHQWNLQTHHSAELIPFVFFAALGGATSALYWLDLTQPRLTASDVLRHRRALASALLAGSFVFHGIPETFYLRAYARTPRDDRLQSALRMIPSGASVSAWTKILPHTAHRRGLYRFPALGGDGIEGATYVLVDEDLLPRTDRAMAAEALAALSAKGYERIFDRDGTVLFRRRANGKS